MSRKGRASRDIVPCRSCFPISCVPDVGTPPSLARLSRAFHRALSIVSRWRLELYPPSLPALRSICLLYMCSIIVSRCVGVAVVGLTEEAGDALEYQTTKDDESENHLNRIPTLGHISRNSTPGGSLLGWFGQKESLSKRTYPEWGNGRLCHLLGLLLELVLRLSHARLLSLCELGVSATLLQCLRLFICFVSVG